MAPGDRLRKVSRNYFSVTAPALLLVSHKRLCVIDTNTPCLAVMALSAENLLTPIMHSCIPIPESFPSPRSLPLLDCKHMEKRARDLCFFFSHAQLSAWSQNQNQLQNWIFWIANN